MSAQINLQKEPIPVGMIGSALEVLALIIQAVTKRQMLKARVDAMANADITQGRQLVVMEAEQAAIRQELQHEVAMLREEMEHLRRELRGL
jgi:hypothetical protein